jgi:hypothetical protein
MRFAVKHAIAAGVVITAMIALATASYVALLVWAVLVGEPLGGPLAFPFMILIAVVASVISVGAVLLPVTALTEWICVRRQIRLQWQIPIDTAVMGMWLLMLAAIGAAVRGAPIGSTAVPTGTVFLLLLVPLGMYWWSMQSADWILRVATRWWSRRRSEPTSSISREAG